MAKDKASKKGEEKPKAKVKPKAKAKAKPKAKKPKAVVEKKPAKMGRPTSYKKEYNLQAMKLCLLGSTDESLANFFEVTVATLNSWKKTYPEFLSSIREGKVEADANVAHSLYNRARGFTCKETKVFNNNGSIITEEIDKHYPPDTGAAFIWLKNRSTWRDKQEVEHSGEVVNFNMDFGGAKNAK